MFPTEWRARFLASCARPTTLNFRANEDSARACAAWEGNEPTRAAIRAIDSIVSRPAYFSFLDSWKTKVNRRSQGEQAVAAIPTRRHIDAGEPSRSSAAEIRHAQAGGNQPRPCSSRRHLSVRWHTQRGSVFGVQPRHSTSPGASRSSRGRRSTPRTSVARNWPSASRHSSTTAQGT